MYNYVYQTARNALYKATRDYEALDMNDNRSTIEQKIRENIQTTLASEKLEGSLSVQQVLVRQMTPADSVVASANDLVRSKNELKQKEVEVKTAEAESRRMQALAAQGSQSIAYMNAQTEQMKAQAMLEAAKKGSLMMVPVGTTPMINIPK
jgi:regulator of protease activity HflC (stomatin/prohibitin superfamily)